MVVMTRTGTLRPAHVCTALLSALNASDGRSRARKRDQTPDSIGLALRRKLLEQVARDDPEPQAFEQWLLNHVADSTVPGAVRAIALAVLDDWHLAHQMPSFAIWLEHGARSDDAGASAKASPSNRRR